MKKFTMIFVFLFAAFSLMKAADTPGNVTFNVDTTGGGFATDDRVFISGDLWGWPAPGDNPDLELFDDDGDGIFSVTLPSMPKYALFQIFQKHWLG